jgi:preprotein translocase subunit SecG
MITVLLIVHLFVTLALIGVVLIQRSEGGGLGIGSSQGMGSFMSGRGTANLLTRTTAILAAIFMALSLMLALLTKGTSGVGSSILDNPPPPAALAPRAAPAPGTGPAPTATAPATTAPATTAPGITAPGTTAPTTTTPAAPPAPKGPSVPTN